MTTETLNKNLVNNDDIPVKEPNTFSNLNPSSFNNYFDQNTVLPFKLFLKENIKSFNLLPNEENSTKENELENSLKVKYNFDTPTLEIVLKITCDYDLIQKKLKEYLALFGEINSLRYDHNANTVKINYKYYFSCLYANRSLTNILQSQKEENSAINYYSNCDFSNKSINTISSEKLCNNINSNKDFNQAFKFLTENYKTNTKFKTQIYRDENNDNSFENNDNFRDSQNGIISVNKTNFEKLKNNDKEYSPKLEPYNNNSSSNINANSYNNLKTKYRSHNSHRKIERKSFINRMNNILYPPNLFYQYLSMNNPKTLKIPVPVPVPVPVPMPITSRKIKENISYNSTSFSKTKIKSSCLNQTKEKAKIQISDNKTKMKTESNNNINDSLKSIKNSNSDNNIINFCDSIIANVNESQQSISKINENNIEKEKNPEIININEDKDSISDKENISSSCNMSKKSSQDNRQKNEIISSIKFADKSNLDFLSTMGQKRLSLDRLNYFLQNNKPISNFNNPIKNLNQDENEAMQELNKKMILPLFFPFPIQSPFKFPMMFHKKNKNQFLFPGDFNKNIIDFDKLTLNTRNTIKFDTYSSRDYYYKYVCNYLIQIENDDNFLVKKRIIGKNGCFLKKIIQEACIKYGDFSTKIRLRGKGSGYLEQNGKESEEPLMLCVSSLNYPTYLNCCLLIDSLLKKIYNDYYDYLLKILPMELKYSVNKKRILKHEFVVNRFNSGSSYGNNKENKNRNLKCNNSKENISKDSALSNGIN